MTVLWVALAFLAYAAAVHAGMNAGKRAYQIDLRIAAHQGRDVAEMVESESGYGDD